MGARRRGARHGGRERRRCTLCCFGVPGLADSKLGCLAASGSRASTACNAAPCASGACRRCSSPCPLHPLHRCLPSKRPKLVTAGAWMTVGSARAEQGKCSKAAEVGGKGGNCCRRIGAAARHRVQGVWGRGMQRYTAALEVRALAFGIEGQGQNWWEQTIAESCILGGLESEIGRDAARASRKMGQGRQQSHDEQSATKCGARRHCEKSGGVCRLLLIGRHLAGGRADNIGRWCSSHPSSVAMLATAASSWCMSWSASACCACASSSCCCSSAAAAACGGEPSPPEL